MPNRTVRPVHFEDFGGADFERLVFAYHLRAGWFGLAWHGQVGSDLGRDIVGQEPMLDGTCRPTVIQCVNRASLTLTKAVQDMGGAVKAPSGKPEAFKFVCRGAVSSTRREQIASSAKKLGIAHVEIWSGVEFEEQLRLRAEFLLQRLVDGVPFPDSETELRRFVDDFPDMSDDEMLEQMAVVFDRAAFRTPFHAESQLPAFQQALEDTISALSTGIWRDREDQEIRRIPSLHHLKSPVLKRGMIRVVGEIDGIRRVFVEQLRAGHIRSCQCDDPTCPVFMVDAPAATALDRARTTLLTNFRALHPPFDVHIA